MPNSIRHIRQLPGELSFGSYGTGSINHLGAELFNSMAKIQANHVPYRGSAPAMTDLIAGRLNYMFDGVSTSLGYLQGGTIRVLGVAGPDRSPVLPDQPTISEAGLPGYDTMVWFGLFAPAGTPKPIVDLLNARTNAEDIAIVFARVEEHIFSECTRARVIRCSQRCAVG